MKAKYALIICIGIAAAFIISVFASVPSAGRRAAIEVEHTAAKEEIMQPYSPAHEARPPRGIVNINMASAGELATLPGIGQQLADEIIRLREERGGFAACEEIMDIPGIGEAKFDAVSRYITTGG